MVAIGSASTRFIRRFMMTAPRLPRRPALLAGIGILAATTLILSGCGAAPTPAPVATHANLTLSIGSLLPETGSFAQFGPPAEAGVALAIDDINAADTGLTISVEKRDSGDPATDIGGASVDDLLSVHVTAIVGPISEGVSRKVIDKIVGSGVLQISPGNTSSDFTRYADHDLYWRTSPSCVLEGGALGRQMAKDGAKTAALIFQNGLCDDGLSEAFSREFARGGGKVVTQQSFDVGQAGLDVLATDAVADTPDAVAILATQQVEQLVPSLTTAGYKGSQLYFTGLPLTDHSATFAAGALTGSTATLPGLDITTLKKFTDRVLKQNPALTDFSYAAESYDAVVLVALAALAANDVSGAGIASKLQEVSGGSGKGTKATTFADAAKIILKGGTVDYDGVSGPITFDDDGDPAGAIIGMYHYAKDNTYTRIN